MSMYFGIIVYIRAFLKDIKFIFNEMDRLKGNKDAKIVDYYMVQAIQFHAQIAK